MHPYKKNPPPHGDSFDRQIRVAPCFVSNPCGCDDNEQHPCGCGCACGCGPVRYPAVCLKACCEDEMPSIASKTVDMFSKGVDEVRDSVKM